MVLGLFSCEIDALLRRANCFLIRYGTRILFLHNGSYWEAVDDRVREDLMKFGFGMTAVVAVLVVFFTIPVTMSPSFSFDTILFLSLFLAFSIIALRLTTIFFLLLSIFSI